MEDFGYSKEQEENYVSSLIKKAFLIGASIFSIFCFIYITMSAINYFSQNRGKIEVIEPESDPIKVIENQEIANEDSMQIDSSIYEDIFGTRKKTKKKVKVKKVVTPAIPPKKEVKTEDADPEFKKIERNKEKIVVYSESDTTDGAKVLLSEVDEKSNKRKFIRVQIAAMTSQRSAGRYFDSLKSRYPDLFQGLEGFVQKADLGKRGVFYRVQIGSFYDQIRAESFCKKYIAQTSKSKADCIVVEWK